MEGDQPLTLKFGNSGSKNRFAPFWFLGFFLGFGFRKGSLIVLHGYRG